MCWAGVGVSVTTGSWLSASTWLINGTSRIPNCGDTVTVSTGDTITIDAQLDLSACASLVYINVDSGAYFSFVKGKKLTLPCNSTVNIKKGGTLLKDWAGGGSSTLIDLYCSSLSPDDSVVWDAGDGTVTGPIIYHRGASLPVTWLYSNASVVGKTVEVTWSTSAEINNDYFTIEKTTDGIHFERAGIVKGAGNSTQVHNYLFIDDAPYTGASFYRIRQTDYDGKQSLSRLMAVNLKLKTTDLTFYPNPAGNSVFISLPPAVAKKGGMLHITDIKGSDVIAPVAIQANKGALMTLDIHSLAQGMYFMQLVSEEGWQQAKLVKQ